MSYQNSCVLAGLSLSTELEAVVERGRQLARCMNLPLVLLHVVDDTALFDYASEFNLSGLLTGEYEEEEVSKELMARRMIEDRLGKAGDAFGTLEIVAGPRAETLEREARKRHAAVIVVGQPETRFGSVVTHLARHAPCDVHIVRVAPTGH